MPSAIHALGRSLLSPCPNFRSKDLITLKTNNYASRIRESTEGRTIGNNFFFSFFLFLQLVTLDLSPFGVLQQAKLSRHYFFFVLDYKSLHRVGPASGVDCNRLCITYLQIRDADPYNAPLPLFFILVATGIPPLVCFLHAESKNKVIPLS